MREVNLVPMFIWDDQTLITVHILPQGVEKEFLFRFLEDDNGYPCTQARDLWDAYDHIFKLREEVRAALGVSSCEAIELVYFNCWREKDKSYLALYVPTDEYNCIHPRYFVEYANIRGFGPILLKWEDEPTPNGFQYIDMDIFSTSYEEIHRAAHDALDDLRSIVEQANSPEPFPYCYPISVEGKTEVYTIVHPEWIKLYIPEEKTPKSWEWKSSQSFLNGKRMRVFRYNSLEDVKKDISSLYQTDNIIILPPRTWWG